MSYIDNYMFRALHAISFPLGSVLIQPLIHRHICISWGYIYVGFILSQFYTSAVLVSTLPLGVRITVPQPAWIVHPHWISFHITPLFGNLNEPPPHDCLAIYGIQIVSISPHDEAADKPLYQHGLL